MHEERIAPSPAKDVRWPFSLELRAAKASDCASMRKEHSLEIKTDNGNGRSCIQAHIFSLPHIEYPRYAWPFHAGRQRVKRALVDVRSLSNASIACKSRTPA